MNERTGAHIKFLPREKEWNPLMRRLVEQHNRLLPGVFRSAWNGLKYSLNLHTLFLMGLSATATLLCSPAILDWRVEINMTLVSMGVIFPLTYSITTAFNRREKGLEAIADMKATMAIIYYTFRDWDRTDDQVLLFKVTKLLQRLGSEIAGFLTRDSGLHLESAYAAVSCISRLCEVLTPRAGFVKSGEGGMSFLKQQIRTLALDLERLRYLQAYRTPRGLVYFTALLHWCLPILLAPHFMSQIDEDDCPPDDHPYSCATPYCNSVLYVLITSTLFMVQYHLEDPYDNAGVDDVQLDVLGEISFLEKLDFDPTLDSEPSPVFTVLPGIPLEQITPSEQQSRNYPSARGTRPEGPFFPVLPNSTLPAV